MPSPTGSLNFAGIRESRRIIVMRRMRGFIFRRKRMTGSMRLKRLVEASIEAGGKELLLIPVAIYWGRSPQKGTVTPQTLVFRKLGRGRPYAQTLCDIAARQKYAASVQ